MRPALEQSVARALEEGFRCLRKARPRTPRLDVEVLLAHVLGCDRTALYAAPERPLSPAERRAFAELVRRRREGEPVAYLLGWKEFYGRRFEVTSGVFIPRPETEALVEAALSDLEERAPAGPWVLELGTGSGAVAVSLACEHPALRVIATDIAPRALQVARRNARRHGVENRVGLVGGDLFRTATGLGRFDLIVSNPPYVGTRCGPQPEEAVVRYEPPEALFAGPDGLEVIRRILAGAPGHLVDGGSLALEVGVFQCERVEALMVERGFRHTRLHPDLSGLPRVVTGRWEER